jgi:cytochrome c5
MSEEAIKAGGLYNGVDKGRIYRITPIDARPGSWTKGLHLGDASNEELVKELANVNRWWRINAQRLLIDRADKQAIPALVQMAKNPASAMGRLHALWTLEGMGALKPDIIKTALNDTVPGIRENAIKLAELHLSGSAGLERPLFALQKDIDPKVRFQLLCTIGFLNTPEAAKAREKLLFENLNDNWLQVAALSARSSQAASLLNVAMNKFKPEDPAYASLAKRLASMIGSGGEVENIRNIISKATLSKSEKQTWQPAVLEGLADGLERRKIASSELQNEQEILIKTFFENPSSSMREAALQLLKVIGIHDESLAETSIKKAVSIMQDRSMPDEKREEAINFLSLRNPVVYQAQLKKLIVPQEQATVQLAALKTLSLIPGLTVSQYILKQWPVLTPEIRDAAISTFLSSPDRVSYLLDAIDSGRIHKSSFSFIQGVQLMTGGDDKLRKRARSIFAHNDAAKVNKEYQQALKLKGDQLKGKTVFIENCALCHQVKGQIGVPFGPDLGTVSKWQPKVLWLI